ncbi:MAG: hypothetical protein WCS56_00350 [Bacilli bacterium]
MRDQQGYETMGRCQELWELDEDCEKRATNRYKEFMNYHVRSTKPAKAKDEKKVTLR